MNQLATAIQRLGSSPELAEKMGRAGWEMLRQRHRAEENYQTLLSLYENLVARSKTRNHGIALANDNKRWQFALRTAASSNPTPIALGQLRKLRVAFIGGWGVLSKYSGIETYCEEVGKRLGGDGT
jgi:hypothetical protein